MADRADGSIVVDAGIQTEDFKAGSAELLAAIKSLSSEVKELGKILKIAFSNNNQSIAGTGTHVQELETTVTSLKQEVQSLQARVAELQSQLDNLGTDKDAQPPISGMTEDAEAAGNKLIALQAEVQRLNGVIATLQGMLAQVMTERTAPVIETTEAEMRIAELEEKIRQLEATISALRNGGTTIPAPQADFSGTVQKTSVLEKSINSVTKSVNNLKPTFKKAMSGSASAMDSFKAKATALETKIADLRKQMVAVGKTKVPTEQYQTLEATVSRLEEKLIRLVKKQDKLSAMGVKENSRQWQNLQYDIDETTRRLDVASQKMSELRGAGKAFVIGYDTATYKQMAEQIISASNALAVMRDQAGRAETKAYGIGTAFREVGTAVTTAAKGVKSALVRGLKKALQTTKNLILHNNKYGKSFEKLRSAVGRFSLGLLGVRAVYGVLRKAVSAFMEENQELSNQLESCWTSLGNLLGPLITRIINLVSTAIGYVTAFLKLLGITGSTAADATEEASNAAEKAQRYLAGFDELNVMSDKSSGSSTDTAVEPIPDAELPDWVKDMVSLMKSGEWAQAAKVLTDNLNNMMNGVDWVGVGTNIGNGLNGALEFLATAVKSFDWYEMGANIGEFFNHAISGVDWTNLGTLLMAGWIIAINTLAGLFHTLDWESLGYALADCLQGVINAIDFEMLGSMLNDGFSGIIAMLGAFISSVDWRQMAMKMAEGILTVLNALITAIQEFDFGQLGTMVGDFLSNIKWGEIFAAIGKLIWGAMGAMFEFLGGMIKSDGAGLLIAAFGLLATNLAAKVAGALFKQPLQQALTSVIAELLKNVIGSAGIGGWGTAILGAGKTLLGTIVGKIGTIATTVLPVIGATLTKIVTGIVAAIGGWPSVIIGAGVIALGLVIAWMKDGGSEVIAGWFEGMKQGLSNLKGWIKDNIVTPFISFFKNLFGIHSPSTVMAEQGGYLISGLLTGIKSGWGSIPSYFNSVLPNLRKTLLSSWNSISSDTVSKWANIRSIIQNQRWMSIGSNIALGIGKGINSGWTWLRNTVINLARNLLSQAKKSLGIHSPSTLFRDVVGLNIGYGIGEGLEDSEESILDSVAGVANAIAEEFNAGQYGDSLLPTEEVDGTLTSFADKITSAFEALLQRLDAIAKNVGFSAPAYAGYVAPYTAAAEASGSGISPESLSPDNVMAYLLSILAELQALSRIMQNSDSDQREAKIVIGGREVFQVVVEENNRAIRTTGTSPLKV